MPSVSIKWMEFLDWPRYYLVLKGSVPWSYLVKSVGQSVSQSVTDVNDIILALLFLA